MSACVLPKKSDSGMFAGDSGFGVKGSGVRMQGSGFKGQGSGSRILGSGFRGSWFTLFLLLSLVTGLRESLGLK